MVRERPALLKIKNGRRFGLATSNSGGRACPSPNTCCASSILASLVELDKAFRFGDEPGRTRNVLLSPRLPKRFRLGSGALTRGRALVSLDRDRSSENR